MNHVAASEPGRETTHSESQSESHHDLKHLIEHAAHLLPSQGPITVFVHHNTLHAFEDLPFDQAVKKGQETYGCDPYLSEDFYRGEVARGRIPPKDLASVLLDDLNEDADLLIGFMGTRYHLRLAMLEYSLLRGTDPELRWLIAETDALQRFRDEASPQARKRLIDQTREWVMSGGDALGASIKSDKDGLGFLLKQFNMSRIQKWTERTWESFTLHLLWRICHNGVHGVKRFGETPAPAVRHRDLLLQATGRDTDLLVHDVLIRFCAAFLDQGFAGWSLPDRASGFFRSFVSLYQHSRPVDAWLAKLPAELDRIAAAHLSPLDSIEESLHLLGVAESERDAFITRTLLALRGWAGMLQQMETNAEWAVLPAPPGTLQEYLAVRLILERLALREVAGETLPEPIALHDLRGALRHQIAHPARTSVDQRAYHVFQLAQARGWGTRDLRRLSKADWSRLIDEIETFGSLERRRIYHHAYERRYRDQTLDALLSHSRKASLGEPAKTREGFPKFQVVCCLDEREESFRRHLEEVEPSCETFGIAGFFGVAMYYRGVAEAQFRPLCPINIKPRHFVQEEPIHSFEDTSRIQAEARRRLGRFSHRLHVGTRTFVGGLLTGMLGSVAAVPLLMRVLLPRRTAHLKHFLGRMITPPVTQLRLERIEAEPGATNGQLGYSVPEMAAIIGEILRGIGLTRSFARLVIINGHGSKSVNNPQEAAYDCGACGGARGGPNARAFASMANDHRVRRILAAEGLAIPEEVTFVGAFHNTCDDSVVYFDLDRLPISNRELFVQARAAIEETRRRNAHERCRRFESAGLTLSPEETLRHVEGRAEDLSQTRPEYGHATNAVCVVGRRSRTRGLFLDRRSFLTSYDPTQDDETGSILTGLLRAVIPVCAGINLEYFFSAVDPSGYGCGTKLPHNVTSLLGVMDGATSDLRPGLSKQMVEIHEPMRLVFIIETTVEIMLGILSREEAIRQLVHNGWVQLVVLSPHAASMDVFCDGRFVPYEPKTFDLPSAPSSISWYQGERDHLGYAEIDPACADPQTHAPAHAEKAAR